MSPEPINEQPSLPPRSFLAGWRKWAILMVVIVLVIAGGYTLWQSRQGTPGENATTSTTKVTNKSQSTTPSSAAQQVTVPIATDIDKDGLSDAREAEVKTNPKLADTDGDQLSDYDEVQVYATDPLKQDTDGDGYPDGDEVRSGNNPKGPGKLFDLPQTLSNINAQ